MLSNPALPPPFSSLLSLVTGVYFVSSHYSCTARTHYTRKLHSLHFCIVSPLFLYLVRTIRLTDVPMEVILQADERAEAHSRNIPNPSL